MSANHVATARSGLVRGTPLNASHFLVEDRPEDIAALWLDLAPSDRLTATHAKERRS